MKSILIVDDEGSIRESLGGILKDEGFLPLFAPGGEEALDLLRAESPDLVLLDIWMKGIDGIETLARIKEQSPEVPVVMMSGHGTIETAVKATRLGAFDFIEKPISLDKLLVVVENALRIGTLMMENRTLKEKIGQDTEIIGESQPIRNLKGQIGTIAPSSGWVLITGENGTGKELVARSIHALSSRRDRNFVEVNCAAIPEELIESELFGHEKGAFTGATASRKGKFDMAHQGTLFLDEIGDMSMKTQAKILRILQERKFERVGGNRTIEVDVRVIAATNKSLEEEIEKGNFRQDLFYRLNVLPVTVPPLRERSIDIKMLVDHFLRYFCGKESRQIKRLSEGALLRLTSYPWPGNVRELKNLIERLVIMTPGEVIEESDLPLPKGAGVAEPVAAGGSAVPMVGSLKDAREAFEREFILARLREFEGNVSRTAEAIEVERSNLHRKIKAYGIELKREE